MTSIETTNAAKNEMKVMVLTDLAALCEKLADNPAITEEMRAKARHFVEKYNLLEPYRGKGNHLQHFEGERLIDQIARFLPRVLEIKSYAQGEPDEEALV
jgi:hypothetical protein